MLATAIDLIFKFNSVQSLNTAKLLPFSVLKPNIQLFLPVIIYYCTNVENRIRLKWKNK